MIERAIHRGDLPAQTDLDQAVTQMVGPLFFRIVSGYRGQRLSPRRLAADFLRCARRLPAPDIDTCGDRCEAANSPSCLPSQPSPVCPETIT